MHVVSMCIEDGVGCKSGGRKVGYCSPLKAPPYVHVHFKIYNE